MSSHSAFIVGLMLLAAASIASSVNITCDGGEECNTCYSMLVRSLLSLDTNRFNMRKVFFPPDKAPPVSVIVYYDFKDQLDNIDPLDQQLWFWTTSTYYHFQPLSVLQYMSLFFTDPVLRLGDRLNLTLDESCAEAPPEYMQVLTQRLQLHAMNYNQLPSVNNEYQPKAGNVTTLNKALTKDRRITIYSIVHQIVFPILVAGISICVISYLIYSEQYKLGDKITDLVNSPDNKGWEMNTNLYIALAMSFVFSFYCFMMSMIGISHGKVNSEKEFGDSWFKEKLLEFYGLSCTIFIQDFLVFVASIVSLICSLCFWCCEQCCKKCRAKCFEKHHERRRDVWWFCVYSLSLPIVNIGIHFNLILIGFIHNPFHATSVGFTYGILTVTTVVLLKIVSFLIERYIKRKTDDEKKGKADDKKSTCWKVVLAFIMIMIAAVFLYAFLIALYFILPINAAFDEAPDRIVNVYQTIIVLFAGLITYWLVIKQPTSPLDTLIKAKDEEEKKKRKKKKQDQEGAKQNQEGKKQEPEGAKQDQEGAKQVKPEGAKQDKEGAKQVKPEGAKQDQEGAKQESEGAKQESEGGKQESEGAKQNQEDDWEKLPYREKEKKVAKILLDFLEKKESVTEGAS